MTRFVRPLMSVGGLSLIAAVLATTANAQPTAPQLPKSPPDTAFDVQARSGNCPKQVKLWTAFRYYEGGGEITVIADTVPFANPVKVKIANSQVAEYEASLKRPYATCVGRAVSPANPLYTFEFQQGKVVFRVDTAQVAKDPSTPAAITYPAVLTSRPYVRWQIAD